MQTYYMLLEILMRLRRASIKLWLLLTNPEETSF